MSRALPSAKGEIETVVEETRQWSQRDLCRMALAFPQRASNTRSSLQRWVSSSLHELCALPSFHPIPPAFARRVVTAAALLKGTSCPLTDEYLLQQYLLHPKATLESVRIRASTLRYAICTLVRFLNCGVVGAKALETHFLAPMEPCIQWLEEFVYAHELRSFAWGNFIGSLHPHPRGEALGTALWACMCIGFRSELIHVARWLRLQQAAVPPTKVLPAVDVDTVLESGPAVCGNCGTLAACPITCSTCPTRDDDMAHITVYHAASVRMRWNVLCASCAVDQELPLRCLMCRAHKSSRHARGALVLPPHVPQTACAPLPPPQLLCVK